MYFFLSLTHLVNSLRASVQAASRVTGTGMGMGTGRRKGLEKRRMDGRKENGMVRGWNKRDA